MSASPFNPSKRLACGSIGKEVFVRLRIGQGKAQNGPEQQTFKRPTHSMQFDGKDDSRSKVYIGRVTMDQWLAILVGLDYPMPSEPFYGLSFDGSSEKGRKSLAGMGRSQSNS
jgi:hypothetical protein